MTLAVVGAFGVGEEADSVKLLVVAVVGVVSIANTLVDWGWAVVGLMTSQ